MAITVQKLKEYMKANKNILIAGEAGTGKTEMLKAAASELDLTMKYYSSSTLDPFADLVGIPVPNTTTKLVEYYRPKEIDEAQIIFFDELNRADPKTINAVMEIIQFRSINGEPLRKLHCVVAAINPVDKGYNTEELDIAVRDRFDIFLTSEVVADYSYFKEKYGAALARAAIDLFKDYQNSYREDQRSKKNTLGYFSPRRLEKILDTFMEFGTAEVIAASLPDDIIIAHKQWSERLEQAKLGAPKKVFDSNEVITNAKELLKLGASDLHRKQYQEPLLKTYKELKHIVAVQKKNGTRVVNPEVLMTPNLNGPAVAEVEDETFEEKLMYRLRSATAAALNAGISTTRIANEYGEIARDFDSNQESVLTRNWMYTKINNYSSSMHSYIRSNPEVIINDVPDDNNEDIYGEKGLDSTQSNSLDATVKDLFNSSGSASGFSIGLYNNIIAPHQD